MKRGRRHCTPEPARGDSPEEELPSCVSGGGSGDTCDKRQLRPRPATINYADQHPDLDEVLGRDADEEGVQGKRRRLDIPQLCRHVEHVSPAQLFTATTHPAQVTAEALAATGLRQPLLVPAEAGGKGGAAATRAALGMQLLPVAQLTPRGLAAAVGQNHQVPTIDVATQCSGPSLTLRQLANYLQQLEQGLGQGQQQAQQATQQAQRAAQQGQARSRQAQSPVWASTPNRQQQRLLNVVSLSLADTALEDAITPPWAVRGLDLVSAVWPPEEDPDNDDEDAPPLEPERPETLLYALMGPAGAYTDWHIDMGGSAVWYHMISGRKVFLAAPPTPTNLAAFEEWSSSDKQVSSWLGDRLEGLVRINLRAGDTLLLPSAWPHAVATPEAAVAVGGNFLTTLDYGAMVGCYRRERRLGITPKFQFPLFRKLMWYAAESTLTRLQQCVRQGLAPAAAGITLWELGGLPALMGLLREWLQQQATGGAARHAADVPTRIVDPAALLEELQDCLEAVQPSLQDQEAQAAADPQPLPAGSAAGAGTDAEFQQQLGLALALGAGGVDTHLGLALALAMGSGGGAIEADARQQQQQQQQEQEEGVGEAHEENAWLEIPAHQEQLLMLGDPLADPTSSGGLPASLLQDVLLPEPLLAVGPEHQQHGAAGSVGNVNALPTPQDAEAAAVAWAEQAVLGTGRPAEQHDGAALVLRRRQLEAGKPPAAFQMVPVGQAGGSGGAGVLLFHQGVGQQDQRHLHSPMPHAGAGAVENGWRSWQSPPPPQERERPLVGRSRKHARGQQQSDSEAKLFGALSEYSDSSGGSGGDSGEDTSGESDSWLRSKGNMRHKPQQDRAAQQHAKTKQQPSRHRMHKAGSGSVAAAAAAGTGKGARAKKQHTAAAAGTRTVAAGKRASAAAGKGLAAAAAARKDPRAAAPPPPSDLHPLGRKYQKGYTITLRKRRQQAQAQVQVQQVASPCIPLPVQSPGGVAAATAGASPRGAAQLAAAAPPSWRRMRDRAPPAAAGGTSTCPAVSTAAFPAASPGATRAAAPVRHDPAATASVPRNQQQQQEHLPDHEQRATQERARERLWERPRSPRGEGEGEGVGRREAERRHVAAEELVQEVAALRAAVKREEALLARVQSGAVSLPDGGTKLAAALAQRREALRRKADVAAGRVLTYHEPGSGAAQGPFTPSELEKLLRAGLARRDTLVAHPQRGTMRLAEALLLPEPLSARLLHERQQEQRPPGQSPAPPGRHSQQQQQQHPGEGRWNGRRQQDCCRWPTRGRWGGRGSRGRGCSWEQQQRREEMEERMRREAEEEAEVEAQAAAGLWTFVNDKGEGEGPYTVQELRDLHKAGVLRDDEDILVHEEGQGISMRIFSLLKYQGLAEAAADRVRQNNLATAAVAATQQQQQQQQQQQEGLPGWQLLPQPRTPAFPLPGLPAGMMMVQHPRYAPPPQHQPNQQQRQQRRAVDDDWDDSVGSGGGDSVGGAELYEPSPAYSPPPTLPHSGSGSAGGPELYSPSRADIEEEREAAGRQCQQQHQRAHEGCQQGGEQSQLGGQPQHTQEQQEEEQEQQGALPSGAVLEAADGFPAGFAPRVVLSEVPLKILATARTQPSLPTAAGVGQPGSACAFGAAAAELERSASEASMELDEEPTAASVAAGAPAEASGTLRGAAEAEEPPPPPPPPPPAPPPLQLPPPPQPVQLAGPAPPAVAPPAPAAVASAAAGTATRPPTMLPAPVAAAAPGVFPPRPSLPLPDGVVPLPVLPASAQPPAAAPWQQQPQGMATLAAAAAPAVNMPSAAAPGPWQQQQQATYQQAPSQPWQVQAQAQQPSASHWPPVPMGSQSQQMLPFQQQVPWAGGTAVVAGAGGGYGGTTGAAGGNDDVGTAVAAFEAAVAARMQAPAQHAQQVAVPDVQQQWQVPMHRQVAPAQPQVPGLAVQPHAQPQPMPGMTGATPVALATPPDERQQREEYLRRLQQQRQAPEAGASSASYLSSALFFANRKPPQPTAAWQQAAEQQAGFSSQPGMHMQPTGMQAAPACQQTVQQQAIFHHPLVQTQMVQQQQGLSLPQTAVPQPMFRQHAPARPYY